MKQTCMTILALALVVAGCTNKKVSTTTDGEANDSTAVVEADAGDDKQGEEVYSLEGIAKAIKGARMVTPFREGRASVVINDKLGVIDKMGHVIVPFEYDYSVMTYSEGILCAHKGETKIYLDRDGKELFTMEDCSPGEFHEGLACISKDGKNGFIDKTGKVVIPFEWEWAQNFSDGRAIVMKEGERYGFIDKTGKVVIPCKYEIPAEQNPTNFSEGLCPVMMDSNHEYYGYINTDGEQVIPKLFPWNNDFHEGLADVYDSETHLYGYIDKTGKMVITLEENWNGDAFHEGVALTRGPSEYAFIDKTGKKLFTVDYKGVEPFSEGLAYSLACSMARSMASSTKPAS